MVTITQPFKGHLRRQKARKCSHSDPGSEAEHVASACTQALKTEEDIPQHSQRLLSLGDFLKIFFYFPILRQGTATIRTRNKS